MTDEHTLETIVQDLAAQDPVVWRPIAHIFMCVLCHVATDCDEGKEYGHEGPCGSHDDVEHDEMCPWRRARELLNIPLDV